MADDESYTNPMTEYTQPKVIQDAAEVVDKALEPLRQLAATYDPTSENIPTSHASAYAEIQEWYRMPPPADLDVDLAPQLHQKAALDIRRAMGKAQSRIDTKDRKTIQKAELRASPLCTQEKAARDSLIREWRRGQR